MHGIGHCPVPFKLSSAEPLPSFTALSLIINGLDLVGCRLVLSIFIAEYSPVNILSQ